MKFIVIGGLNLDVTGVSDTALVSHDSNIGKVSFSAGGVAANIARALKQEGHEAELITVLSDDFAGRMLETAIADERIGLSLSVRANCRCSSYMSIHGPDGDMELAVNDMDALKLLTGERILERADVINASAACVIDANLSSETLKAIAETAKVPLIADCVSAAKCRRLLPIAGSLDAIKPNMLEAEALTGETSPEAAARKLMQLGIKRVFISLGPRGVYAADEHAAGYIQPSRIFNCQTTGAGDALCAGIAEYTAKNLNALECAENAVKCSERLLESRS